MFYRLKKNVRGGGVRPRVKKREGRREGDEPINYIQAWPWFQEGDSDFNQVILKILSMHCKYFVHSEP